MLIILALSLGTRLGCFLLLLMLVDGLPCRMRQYGQHRKVCVCSAKYCDDPGPPPEKVLRSDTTKFLHFESSRAGKRLERTIRNFTDGATAYYPRGTAAKFKVSPDEQFQEIFGFGGALTDAVGINLSALDNHTQEILLRQYFGFEGIGYTFLRIPMGGTDFSSHNYTYADQFPNDMSLSHFALSKEDYIYKMHYTRWAQEMSPRPIKLLTVSWSAPEWMKEPRLPMNGFTKLQEKYYQLYADYFVKFLEEYKSQGFEFWALSPQNEPHDGLIFYYGFNSMGWLPEEERKWIGQFLGPALSARGFNHIKVLMMDDQRALLQQWAFTELSDPVARSYISGIALHWYADRFPLIAPITRLDEIHFIFPDILILYTEASIMHSQKDPAVLLGSWDRGEAYAVNILQNLNHWVVGWLDWNLVLDPTGGPTWAHNNVDSPIIINATANEFYKQPMFYAIAHFSRFVLPGSCRIKLSVLSKDDCNISSIAFVRPDNYLVVVLLNTHDDDKMALVEAEEQGVIELAVSARSFHTVIYKNKKDIFKKNYGCRLGVCSWLMFIVIIYTILNITYLSADI